MVVLPGPSPLLLLLVPPTVSLLPNVVDTGVGRDDTDTGDVARDVAVAVVWVSVLGAATFTWARALPDV
ncbi:hypothetical protein E2C01_081991 [Portunus trituberculatus]|uniref:Uncharacterized protein n=1 Tax=Portunus trituberculatus TaxID=210409 RepID=A0A5B7IXX5_PORTR|nr:hypothetical protein [Portunus trituberculatus]